MVEGINFPQKNTNEKTTKQNKQKTTKGLIFLVLVFVGIVCMFMHMILHVCVCKCNSNVATMHNVLVLL